MSPRSVLVTGATSGVGRETALRLAGRGLRVYGTALDAEEAGELHRAAAARGVTLRTVLLDAADPRSCRDAFDEVAAETDGGPWALVNNAGILRTGAVEDFDDDTVDRLLQVNLLGAARLTRLALPAMRRRGDGRVVNNSSAAGRITLPLMGWYCAGKAAMGAWNDALRMEAGPGGVRVALVEARGYGGPIWERAADDLACRAAASGTLFAEAYRRLERSLREAARKPGPEPLVRALVHALTSPRPRDRYVIGARSAVAADLAAPRWASDPLKRIAMGLEEGEGG
ncbi:SDR family NAD(P)-dependent oxidoreductase, partial [Streptomyces sp. URMC 126]|uniref:SDR family NAD(P)-dependent oxidoreductase n=1 Tax=Streptomyces sp. URMC 126 TaxID=3423401 RepID=UPI003F1C0AE2